MGVPDFYSLSAYGGALCVSMIFAAAYERTHRRGYWIGSFLTTLFFCGFRFYVGNDYDGYFNYFQTICTYPDVSWYIVEPAYVALNLLFSFSPIGYFYVLFVSSAITFSIVYYLLAKQGALKWGVFAIYTLGFLIIANDQVRQMIAVSIVFLALHYIDEKKPLNYLLLITLAATFHYSSAVCILLYPLKYIKTKKGLMIMLLCIAFIIKLTGEVDSFIQGLFQYIYVLNESYAEQSTNDIYYSGVSFGFQLLFFWIISILILISLPSLAFNNIFIKVFSFGASLYTLFWGQMQFERISLYLFEVIIFAFPMAVQQKKWFAKMAILLCVFYYSLQSMFALEKNGAVPYRTIFHENLISPRYDRETQQQ